MIALMVLSLMAGSTTPEQHLMGTGNDVLAICSSTETDDQMGCFMWIKGVIGATYVAMADVKTCVFELPSGVTGLQEMDVIRAYLKSHAEVRHLPGAVLAMRALKEAFPCPKAQAVPVKP